MQKMFQLTPMLFQLTPMLFQLTPMLFQLAPMFQLTPMDVTHLTMAMFLLSLGGQVSGVLQLVMRLVRTLIVLKVGLLIVVRRAQVHLSPRSTRPARRPHFETPPSNIADDRLWFVSSPRTRCRRTRSHF